MAKFLASLYRLSIDKEAESTVILKVPQSDLAKVVPLLMFTEKLLKVEVELDEGGEQHD